MVTDLISFWMHFDKSGLRSATIGKLSDVLLEWLVIFVLNVKSQNLKPIYCANALCVFCSASLCLLRETVTWWAVLVKDMSDLQNCHQQARARLHENWLSITALLIRCLPFVFCIFYRSFLLTLLNNVHATSFHINMGYWPVGMAATFLCCYLMWNYDKIFISCRVFVVKMLAVFAQQHVVQNISFGFCFWRFITQKITVL